jgi:hypothetical protein
VILFPLSFGLLGDDPFISFFSAHMTNDLAGGRWAEWRLGKDWASLDVIIIVIMRMMMVAILLLIIV